MKNWLKKTIRIIGMPFDMGASRYGARLGPEALRIAGLSPRLEELGYPVKDRGNLDIKNDYKDTWKDKLKNYDLVYNANQSLAEEVYKCLEEGDFPLILGGDHTQVLGSVKGVLKNTENLGLIYFDAHADINTEETSLSGNIHGMPIAFLLDRGDEKMRSLAGSNRYLKAENIVYIGLRDLDPGEKRAIRDLGIRAYSVDDIDRLGLDRVLDETLEYFRSRVDKVHISFDVDCLDPKVAPGTGVKVPGGLTFREAKRALMKVRELENIGSVEFVEVNPLLDDRNSTAELTVELIAALFGSDQIEK